MQNERFAEAFKKGGDQPSNFRNTYAKTLLSPAARWAETFSYLVDAHLYDYPTDDIAIEQLLTIYESDLTRQLLRSTIKTGESVAAGRANFSPHLNALNFHTLNQEMSPNWWTLTGVGDRTPPDYLDITRMQTSLSIQGLRAARANRLHQIQPRMSETQSEYDHLSESLTGQITEIDAAIALLEVAKQLPIDERDDIVILPSPPKYEGNSRAASDFLIFDTAEKQVRGIQVKTRLRPSSKYDENYVSFIDGVNDLGNYEVESAPSGRDRKRAVPGLLAADFILHNEGLTDTPTILRNELFRGLQGQIINAKETARELFPENSESSENRVEWAAEAIGRRILSDLYSDTDVI